MNITKKSQHSQQLQMAEKAVALLEKNLEGWRTAQLLRASREMGRSAGHNTMYLVVNPLSRVYIMNETLQECETR